MDEWCTQFQVLDEGWEGYDFHVGHCACFLGEVVYATDSTIDFKIFKKE